MIIFGKHLLSTTALASCLILTPAFAATQADSSSAAAQGAQSRQTRPTAPEEAEPARVQDVVVTGSRIRRTDDFTSAQPLTVITTEYTELRGVPDAATALLTSPLAAGSSQINDQLTGYVAAGGGGTQSISLRGLGEQRTLTLINGRRAGPAGTRGQVQAFDLNVIPQAQVERFEILKDGASSTYGSDAVAGVINVLTRKNWDGAQFNAFASQPFDNGGEQVRIDGAWGKTFDRGYISVAAEYYEAFPLLRKDRKDTACTAHFNFNPDTGAREDHIDPRTGQYKCYNLNTNYVQIASNSMNLVPVGLYGDAYDYNVAGNNSPYAGWARFSRGGYPGTYLYQPSDPSGVQANSTVISPVERVTLSLNLGYDLTPGMEAYGEFLLNRRKSSQIGAAQVFQSFAQRSTLNGALNLLPGSNPNNIFGEDVTTISAYESSAFQEVDYARAVVGLRGGFTFRDRDFNWDIYGQYSRSDAVHNYGPRLYLDRFLAVNSPNVACTDNPAGGNVSNFSCSALPNGVPWMSPRVLAGNFNQAERDFLFISEDHATTYDHAYVEGILTTDRLFDLPAGPLGVALGFQSRYEKINDTPGEQARNRNIALYSLAGITEGSDTINEIFGELEAPLLRDLPFVDQLTLNLSGRFSDYRSYGASETYKANLNWAVTPEWRLRASTGTSFRAPALYELFLGNQTSYGAQSTTDPCYEYGNSSVDPEIKAACARLGIPEGYNASGSSSILITAGGGRDILKAETAKTSTLGLVWTPRFADLNVAVDYFDIAIEDEVRQFGVRNIIEQCLRGNTEFCGLYQRNADFHITTAQNNYVNVARQTNRGIDLAVRYSRDLGFANLTFASQNTWQLENRVNLLGGQELDYKGTTFNYSGPAYAGNINLLLDFGDFAWNYGVDMIGPGTDLGQAGVNEIALSNAYADFATGRIVGDCSQPNNYCVRFKRTTEFTSYHSTSLRYRVDGWTFQVGVNNIFDERPPALSAGFRLGTAALNGYDMRGRRGFVRVGRSF